MKKKVIIGGIIFIGALLLFLKLRSNSTQTPQYQTAQVEKGTLVASLSTSNCFVG